MKKHLFKQSKITKELNKLRSSLKEVDIVTKASYKEENCLVLYFERSYQSTYGHMAADVSLEKSEQKNVLFLTFHGMHRNKNNHNQCIEIFDFIKTIGTLLGTELILSEGFNSQDTAFYGFTQAKDVLDDFCTVELLGSDKTDNTFFKAKEEVYFFEAEEGIVQRKMDLVNTVTQTLEDLKTEDETFTVNYHYMNSDFTGAHFYYEGFNGTINLHYNSSLGNPFMVELKKGEDFFNQEQVETILCNAVKEIPDAIKRLVITGVESMGFMNLIKPPRKHFVDYFLQNLSGLNKYRDDIFELLMTRMEPKQIELQAQKREVPTKFEYEGNYFFEVLDWYFVRNKEKDAVYMFDTQNEAALAFKTLCEEMERAKYESKLQRINQITEQLVETI